MKGRKPKPTEVKRREGARVRRETVLVGGRKRPTMPRGLPDRAKTIWNTVVADLERGGVLDQADWPVIEAFCIALCRAREAREDIRKHGRYTEGQKGSLVIAPWVTLEAQSWKEVRQLADHLGLGPSGRARLGISGDKGRSMEDEFDDEIGASPRRLRAVQ